MFDAVVKTLPLSIQDPMREFYMMGGFKGPCSALAMSIWQNKAMETILNKVGSCSHVNSQYTKNKFTPMTLAAIQGNLPAMEALKTKGADLDAQDILGYTALHHMAMLGNEAGIKKLLDWDASSDLRTSHGATYMDLLRFSAPFRNGTIPLDPKLFSAHTNDPIEFDRACIPSDAEPVEEMVATPAMLMAIYAQGGDAAGSKEGHAPSPNKLEEAFLSKYDAFKKNPQPISVKPVGDFCGLFATRLIKKGELIAEYTGKLTSPGWYPPYKEYAYLAADYPAVDAGPFRSAAAMANDGFPNTSVFALGSEKGLDGLPNRKLLFALENIEPGEEIRVNYGSKHDLKKDENYQELGFEALQKYLNSHAWDDIFRSVQSFLSQELTPGSSEYLDGFSNLEKSRYILETSTVIQRAAKERMISQKDIERIRELNRLYALIDPDGKELRAKGLDLAIKTLGQRKKSEL